MQVSTIIIKYPKEISLCSEKKMKKRRNGIQEWWWMKKIPEEMPWESTRMREAGSHWQKIRPVLIKKDKEMLNPSSSDFLYGRREQHSTKWEEMGRGRTDLTAFLALFDTFLNTFWKNLTNRSKVRSSSSSSSLIGCIHVRGSWAKFLLRPCNKLDCNHNPTKLMDGK